MGARGRMSCLTLNPPAKPATLCGTLHPDFENKGVGLTLARQPPVLGQTPSLLGPFKAALLYLGQALALRVSCQPLRTWTCGDVTSQTGLWANSELKNTAESLEL